MTTANLRETINIPHIFAALSRAITIGLERKEEPTTEDDGVLAIDSGLELVDTEKLKQIPDGRRVIVTTFGGTKWRVRVDKMKGGQLIPGKNEKDRSFSEYDRLFDSPQAFVDAMADLIAQEIGTPLPGAKPIDLAISFGFPNDPTVEKREDRVTGIDATLLKDSLPKEWEVKGGAGQSLSEPLRTALQKLGFPVGGIFFSNDTLGVAQDRPITSEHPQVSGGIVAGSGTNGSLVGPRGTLVNLELGAFPLDESGKTILEHITGGTYLWQRFTDMIDQMLGQHILTEEDANTLKAMEPNGKSLSSLADPAKRKASQINNIELVQRLAAELLTQAGQMIGTLAAAMAKAGNWGAKDKTWQIPIEGSVFWLGYGVREQAEQTLADLLPDRNFDFVEADSMRGQGNYALTQHIAAA